MAAKPFSLENSVVITNPLETEPKRPVGPQLSSPETGQLQRLSVNTTAMGGSVLNTLRPIPVAQDYHSSFDEEDQELDTDVPIRRKYDFRVTGQFRRVRLFRALVGLSCAVSLTSVCMNTPATFKMYPYLIYVTLFMDIGVAIFLSFEVTVKMIEKGLFRKSGYFRSLGRCFEALMVLLIVVSICLQVAEIHGLKPKYYIYYSACRAPRPLILFRFLKNILHVGLPKRISRRSLTQVQSVLLFSIYLMLLAAVIGVQLFGPLKYYCVRDGADMRNISASDFTIPATRCSNSTSAGYLCPSGFKCQEVKFSQVGQSKQYYPDALNGLLAIYEAASMEGWSFVMYSAMDTRHFLFAVVYFPLVIFFIAFLMRNVFVAIVTETFQDLRSQVHRHFVTLTGPQQANSQRVFKLIDSKIELVNIDEKQKGNKGLVFLQNIVRSKPFNILILLLIVTDSVCQGLFSRNGRFLTQLIFTCIFDVEAIGKMIAYYPRNYFKNMIMSFEFVLCVGGTVSLIPLAYQYEAFSAFQVLRLFRLAFAFSSLTSFLHRILGSGKKLGGLILITFCFLIITTGISLQLFCNIDYGSDPTTSFQTFPYALQAMFQIMMVEAWNDVMHFVLFQGHVRYAPLVFGFFILYHMIAAIILISVFVALILDNLELDEEVKLIRQRKLGDEVADIKEKLPHRLQLFQHFKANPKMIKMEEFACSVPKVRESFMRKFYLSQNSLQEMVLPPMETSTHHSGQQLCPVNPFGVKLTSLKFQETNSFFSKVLRKQSSVTALINDSHLKKIQTTPPSEHNPSGNKGNLLGSVKKSIKANAVMRGKNYATVSQSPTVKKIDFELASKLTAIRNVNGRENDQGKRIIVNIDTNKVKQKLVEAERKKEAQVEHLRENYPFFDQSLFLLSYKSSFRHMLQKIVHARYEAFPNSEGKKRLIGAFSRERVKQYIGTQTYLDWVMIFLTQISVLFMMFETPQEHTFDRKYTEIMEYIFVATTSAELTLKILADGLFFTPNAFIQDFNGVIHVFIYFVGLLYVCWHPRSIPPQSGMQILLVLRALRPLRIITLAPPLRKVVRILIRGYKDILKVAILQFLLMYIFASYGHQTFAGKLARCNDRSITTKENCTGVFWASPAGPASVQGDLGGNLKVVVPRVWRNPRNFNFDTLPSSFLAVFEILSLEGWTEVRDILRNQAGWVAAIYPHVYVFFAALVGLTLFIGIVVSNFNENKGTALLTVDQRRWEDLKKRLKLTQPLHMPPRPDNSGFRTFLYDVLQTKPYRYFYYLIVLLNCSTLTAGEWFPQSLTDLQLQILTNMSVALSFVFLIDMIIKIGAYKFSGYTLSMRNNFDMILTILGILWSILKLTSEYLMKDAQAHIVQIGVALIILRLLSLSGKSNTLQMLMLTVLMSLLKSFYTVSVLVVLMMCYALAGVVLFGTVKFGVSINRHANFRTSWRAMLLLFRITTGEDWNKLMHDCMVQLPYCTKGENFWESDCGYPVAALIFFCSYYIIVTYIFVNLFIAVVIENFSLFYSTDEDLLLSNADIKNFQETWNIVDKDRKGNISVTKAKLVLRLLKGRLEIDEKKERFLFKRMCLEIEKLRNGKNVSFHDLLFMLAYKSVDIARSLQLEERLAREELEVSIMEEAAAQTIRGWFYKNRQNIMERVKKDRVGPKCSVSSVVSTTSLESEPSEADDACVSLSSISSNQLSPSYQAGDRRQASLPTGSASFDHPPRSTAHGVRKLSGSRTKQPKRVSIQHEGFTRWWDEVVTEEKKDK